MSVDMADNAESECVYIDTLLRQHELASQYIRARGGYSQSVISVITWLSDNRPGA